MIYIDLDADLNMEDDDGRNFTRVAPPAGAPNVGSVLVAGRPDFWSWVVVDEVDGEIVYFHQVSARHAAGLAQLVTPMSKAVCSAHPRWMRSSRLARMVQPWHCGAIAGVRKPGSGSAALAVFREREPLFAVLGPVEQDILEATEHRPPVQYPLQPLDQRLRSGRGEVEHVRVAGPGSLRPDAQPAIFVVEVFSRPRPRLLQRRRRPHLAGAKVDTPACGVRVAGVKQHRQLLQVDR